MLLLLVIPFSLEYKSPCPFVSRRAASAQEAPTLDLSPSSAEGPDREFGTYYADRKSQAREGKGLSPYDRAGAACFFAQVPGFWLGEDSKPFREGLHGVLTPDGPLFP